MNHPIAMRALLGAALLAAHVATAQPTDIPTGGAITLDGTLDETEWWGAVRQPLEGGGEVWLRHDGAFLYVGVRGTAEGWSHVYVPHPDTVRVLHASAALGTAIYRPQGAAWEPVQAFDWAVRAPDLGPEAQAARAAFLGAHGWVASTNRMGTPTDIEFQIDRRLFAADDPRLAVVYASDAEHPHFWPASLADDTRRAELIFGTTPAGLRFEPAQWTTLAFQVAGTGSR